MDNVDDVLKNVYSSDIIEARKAQAGLAYEEKVVKKLLASIGHENAAGKLAQMAKEKTGKARVSLVWFNEFYPTYPLNVFARKIGFAFRTKPVDLFGKFCSTPMFKAWEECCDEAPDNDLPVGVVFDWPGVPGTQMIIHDADRYVNWFNHHTRITRSVGQGKSVRMVTIEQLDTFLAYVAENWIQ